MLIDIKKRRRHNLSVANKMVTKLERELKEKDKEIQDLKYKLDSMRTNMISKKDLREAMQIVVHTGNVTRADLFNYLKKYYDVSQSDIDERVTENRKLTKKFGKIAFFMKKFFPSYSYKEVSQLLNYRDHSMALYHDHKLSDLLELGDRELVSEFINHNKWVRKNSFI